MLRGIYGDPERYKETYWCRFEGRYFAGDGAKIDDDGYFWLLGRVDDVMNVSGHRISTTEVESALVDHPKVAEAAVVGAKDDTTGQAIIAYVTVKGGTETSAELGEELRQHVAKKIGPTARPKTIIFTDDLPKTRSRQDHAPAARATSPRAATSATPPRSPTPRVVDEITQAGRGIAAPRSRRVTSTPDNWRWRDGAVGRRAGRRLRHRRRAVRRGRPPALHRAAGGADWEAFFARLRRRSAHRRGGAAARRCSTRACAIVLLTGRPIRVQRQTLAWLTATSCGGTCCDARHRRLPGGHASSSNGRSASSRDHGFDLRLAFEDDRRNVAMFHARASRASTSTPGTTSSGQLRSTFRRMQAKGTTEWIDLLDPDEEELRRCWPTDLHCRALEVLLAPHTHADEPRPEARVPRLVRVRRAARAGDREGGRPRRTTKRSTCS